MKKIFLKLCVVMLAIINTPRVEAKLPKFKILCEQSPEVYFIIEHKKFSHEEYYEAGFTFRGTEVGSPYLCDLKNDKSGSIHLSCEDQNIDSSYDLILKLPRDGSFFEVKMQNSDGKIETLNLCRLV